MGEGSMGSFLTESRLAVVWWALLVAVVSHAAFAEVPDYEFRPVPRNRADAAKPVPKYRFLFGNGARWIGPMRWKYNHANAPEPWASDSANAAARIRAALEVWQQSCGITFVYEGETTVAPDTRVQDPRFGEQPDYVNVVGWDGLDGNTSGLTYAWYESGDGGDRALVDADILLSTRLVIGEREMTRTGTHEWGHAIGLGHSNLYGALMSGPPDSLYNALVAPQTDDVRGCRCLYGAAAGQAAGFSCSLPEKVELGGATVGNPSTPRQVTLANHGNAPLAINAVTVSSSVLSRDDGCASGSTLAPGQSCAVTLVGRPTHVYQFAELLTFDTSDGAYNVAVNLTGIDGPATGQPVVQLVEYFHAGFGHYFVTHLVDEIAKLDDGRLAGWTRTGRVIGAWSSPTGTSAPVCRFYSARFTPKSSHFYTSFASECQTVRAGGDWSFEGEVFHVALPDAQGACGAGTQAVYRLYNNGLSGAPNHRFTTDATLRQQMIAQGWSPEGAGLGVTMCAPL